MLTKAQLLNYIEYYYKGIPSELEEDIKKYKFINRFLIRLSKNKPININLLCNHSICLYNVFDSRYITYLLYASVNSNNLPYLKTTLLFLRLIKEDNNLFKSVSFSYELDLLLSEKAHRY